MTVDQPLPPSQFASVLLTAAAALNRLEAGDHEEQREQFRLKDIEKDRRALAHALTTLRELTGRYCDHWEAQSLAASLAGVEYAIGQRLDGEGATWLTPKEGRPRRHEFDQFAHVILALATDKSDDWNVSSGARATAAVVDSVWANDARTKAVSFARALWGQSYSSNRRERIISLAEELRQRAQLLKRTALS